MHGFRTFDFIQSEWACATNGWFFVIWICNCVLDVSLVNGLLVTANVAASNSVGVIFHIYMQRRV